MAIDLTNAELTMAKKVATESRRRYSGYVESDDVYQELVIWQLGHEDKVREWREGYGYKALYRSLKNEAHRICEKEKAAKVGYGPEDNSGYAKSTLRELLKVALRDDWPEAGGVDGKPHSQLAAQVMDVRRGLQLIPDTQAHVLIAAVDESFEYDLLAELYSDGETTLLADTVRKRVDYALGKLQDVLSGKGPDREYTGRRKVMSRAQAQAILNNQWGKQ